jgi:hypothetical protein
LVWRAPTKRLAARCGGAQRATLKFRTVPRRRGWIAQSL